MILEAVTVPFKKTRFNIPFANSTSNVLGITYVLTWHIIYMTCLQSSLLLKNMNKENFLPLQVTPQLQTERVHGP